MATIVASITFSSSCLDENRHKLTTKQKMKDDRKKRLRLCMLTMGTRNFNDKLDRFFALYHVASNKGTLWSIISTSCGGNHELNSENKWHTIETWKEYDYM